nr:hypothetical protein [Kibdelosporangium sp. MJ126-NF4]CEL21015.1 hypothetical protein [Kibdelosporangium sp. MJ126-NF4]CTQ95471.1 hypothetical protein [Kibdelosporangium sp. MJ126-NF4]
MQSDHEDKPPVEPESVVDPIAHVMLAVLSVVVLFFGFLSAAMARGAPEVLMGTLIPPLAGVLIAVRRRHWIVLVPHGAMIALNLYVILAVA